MSFEVPAWGMGDDVIKFKSVHGATTAAGNIAKKLKKKKKPKAKKVKQDSGLRTAFQTGRGPLAPPPADYSDDEADDGMWAMHKARSGRIEKQKPNRDKNQKNLKIKPELVKAAMEAMEEQAPEATPPQAKLANKLQSELLAGRFRYINEQLYTMHSKKAEQIFSTDSGAFEAYHAGYRQQVQKWPSNPLERIIKMIKRLPKTAIIGDFGCGEGKLAQAVPHKVYSMDLVAARAEIISCNITKTPLQPLSLDVAVFCLSLMGTNLSDYLLEANRVLKLHGNLYIAEIQSRFEELREFVRLVKDCGFELVKKDVAINYFYFFQFRKMRHVGKDVKLKPFSLKPCLYRKR